MFDSVRLLLQVGLNEKEVQMNLCNVFSIFTFNEFYIFAYCNHSQSLETRARSYFYEISG